VTEKTKMFTSEVPELVKTFFEMEKSQPLHENDAYGS
jgi:hypothetical protein